MLFTRLLLSSISTFHELHKKFVEQFRFHDTWLKDVISLSILSEGPKELLKGFSNKFNITVTEVSNPMEDIIFIALICGIQLAIDFGRLLKMKQPTTMEKFHWKVKKILPLEEESLVEGKVSDG